MNAAGEAGAGVPAEPARVEALRPDQVDALIALAGDTWRRHYPGIISPEQIEYMLAQRYRPELILAHLAAGEPWWDTVSAGGRLLAFSCCEPDTEHSELKIDRLYVRHDLTGRGYGGMLLRHAEARARAHGLRRLFLQVNRRNTNAIAAYRRSGFEVERTVVVDIGGGFVMDDYVMTRAVPPAPAPGRH